LAFDPAIALPFVGEALKNLRQELEGSNAAVIGFIGMPFTILTYLVEGRTGTIDEFAATRKMMQDDPLLLKDILEMLADRLVEYAVYQANAGAQIIQLFDSWAGWLGPDLFDQFAFPHQLKVVRQLKRRIPNVPLIIYMAPLSQSRGGAYLEKLAATGVDVVRIDYTINLEEARRRLDAAGFGHVTLQGNLEPAILRNGPPERIVEKTENILRAAAEQQQNAGDTSSKSALPFRRHIMNLGHGIDKTTSENHAALFVKTTQHFQLLDKQ
jgi:uroporphyrinogen decarboxylase